MCWAATDPMVSSSTTAAEVDVMVANRTSEERTSRGSQVVLFACAILVVVAYLAVQATM